MDGNAEELLRISDRLFSKKRSLDSLRDVLREEFFPEREPFLSERVDGDEYARNTYESVPMYNRRSLADAIGALVRPKQKRWGLIRPDDESLHTDNTLAWCDWATERQFKRLYGRTSNFQRAMRAGDNDIVTFGDGVASLTEDDDREGKPFFDWHHLRDCAWTRNRRHEVDVLHRTYKIEIREFARKYGTDKLPVGMSTMLETNPFHEIEMRHICMPADRYDGYNRKVLKNKRYASITLCKESGRIVKEGGYDEFPYIVRPWETHNYSPYAYSPAAMLGLCDARLLQSQAAILLDAGERAVNPPMIATQEAILGGVNSYAGSITWIDAEYDERLGAAIRPVETVGSLPTGLDMKLDTREIIAAIWYINKLNLPTNKDMTAYEVNERVSEYIRSIGPVIEPFEDHNKSILDAMFQFDMRLTMSMNKVGKSGPLGWYEDIPQELRGVEMSFEIEGPVAQAYQRQKTVKAGETLETAERAAKLFGPTVLRNYDPDQIVRDAAKGIGGETRWMRPIEVVMAEREQEAAAQAEAAQMQKVTEGIDMAKNVASVVPAAAAANLAVDDAVAGMDAPEPDDRSDYPQGWFDAPEADNDAIAA